MAYRTICDLPPELLHIILSQLRNVRDSSDLRSCSLVCRSLRTVAVEYFFRSVKVLCDAASEPLTHFHKFLRENERAASSVISLQLSGTRDHRTSSTVPIDDTMVASIVQLLPNMRCLALNGLLYAPPPATPIEAPLGPFPLRYLSVVGDNNPRSSLSSLLRVISLFTVNYLNISSDRVSDFSTRFDIQSLHRPLAVKTLATIYPIGALDPLIEALSHVMARDSPNTVRVDCDTPGAVSAVGKLLARTGGSITHLELRNGAPMYMPNRAEWQDPLEDNWSKLNISACTKLEGIVLEMHYRPQLESAPVVKPLTMGVAGVLSEAPSTLRFITLDLYDVPCSVPLTDRRTLDLQAVDGILTGSKFPVLKEVWLSLRGTRSSDWTWPSTAAEALRGLKSRGKLTIEPEFEDELEM